MATLEELDRDGDLVAIHVDLDPGMPAWRRLYGTNDMVQWLGQILPGLESTTIGAETSPEEQVDDIFHAYLVGEEFPEYRTFKPLNCSPERFVWEFKTLDIRIFGWIPQRNTFVCTYGDLKDEIEIYNKYGRYIAQTEYIRRSINLDEPKCIMSREMRDAVSTPPR